MSSGIARKLVDINLIAAEDIEQAIVAAQAKNVSLLHYLHEENILPQDRVAMAMAHEFGLPFLDLAAFEITLLPNLNVKINLDPEYKILPIGLKAAKIYVAISDPTNLKPLEDLKFQTGKQIEAIIVEEGKLAELIRDASSLKEIANLEDIGLETIAIDADNAGMPSENDKDDTPIIKFVNKIILDAINMGASDIHLEPYEKTFRIRLRKDGLLHELNVPPAHLAPRLAARIKVMSQLDISEKRLPQDGRFKMRLSQNSTIDFRVSTCPTLYGEKIVIRILDPTNIQIGIEALGFEGFQREIFLEAINKPQGIILVTGPTGSGKTVTLYTGLNLINTPDRNISTAEDPVEINLFGVNQVNVNVKAGLTFGVALRAFLRQDPDVIMVGEIRDLETAEIAIKAAQTGHLVLSTLHTNTAPDTITRLINMGIPSYNLATAINVVMAQRLVRKLCPVCKVRFEVPKDELLKLGFQAEELDQLTIFVPNGCNQCKKGYKGRVGIYEVMKITKNMQEVIMNGGNAIDLAREAQKEGMWNLRQSGLHKVKLGLTSIEEIERVTKD